MKITTLENETKVMGGSQMWSSSVVRQWKLNQSVSVKPCVATTHFLSLVHTIAQSHHSGSTVTVKYIINWEEFW